MELPDEMIANILARLPIKDILNCKRVCKSWYSLISNPYFTTYHAKNSPFTTIFLSRDYTTTDFLFLTDFDAANGELTNIHIKPKIPQIDDKNSSSRVTLLGSCDASLFLLHRAYYCDHETHKVYMCNPLLGECVKVTEDEFVNLERDCLVYKVGYIPSTNAYKLVRYVYNYDLFKIEEAAIFTVGLDKSWRNLNDPLSNWDSWSIGPLAHNGVFLVTFNGVYHWVAQFDRRRDPPELDTICTFDLSEEKSGTGIPKPSGLSRLNSLSTSLTIVNDCLSLIDYLDSSRISIWTMNEYGVAESWSEDIIVLRASWTLSPRCFVEVCSVRLVPIVVLPNGDIIFSVKSNGSIYFLSRETNQCMQRFRGVDNYAVGDSKVYASAYAPRFCSLSTGS